MDDQIIDAAMAQALQIDVVRTRPMVGWVVMRDPPDYPGKIIAHLVTDRSTPYVLMAENLAELQAQLPSGLVRVEHQSADLPEVVEIWFPAQPVPRRSWLAFAGTAGAVKFDVIADFHFAGSAQPLQRGLVFD